MMRDKENQNTPQYHDHQQDTILLLLGELRGDVKAILVNQERLAARMETAETKIDEHKAQMNILKTRQAYMVGWAGGVGAVVGGVLMVWKDKIVAALSIG